MRCRRPGARLPPAALWSLALGLASLADAGIGAPLQGQLKSRPVYGLVSSAPGLSAGLDYGSGLNAASGRGRHLGGLLDANRGRLRVSLAAGMWDPGPRAAVQFGGTVAVRLLGNPQRGPVVDALLGAGSARVGPADTSTRYLQVPAGLVISGRGLTTGWGSLLPWLGLRTEVDWVWFAGNRASQSGVGVALGASAQVSRRVELHGALDWSALAGRFERGISLPARRPLTIGVGVHVLATGSR